MSARTDAVVVKQPRFGGALGRRANAAVVAEKTRGALTALNLHFAGLALLALLNVYLLVHMAYLWQTAHSQNADALAQQRVQLKTAQIAAAPLEGLDGKLTRSTDDADDFYRRRLPYAYSQAYSELGTAGCEVQRKTDAGVLCVHAALSQWITSCGTGSLVDRDPDGCEPDRRL